MVGPAWSDALLFLLPFLASLTGVMGESLDTDLVGVVVAAVCIAILCVVIIAFSAYCCFRQVGGTERKSVVSRKETGSEPANVPPRWSPTMVPSSSPVYGLATDTVLYALPQGAGSRYYHLSQLAARGDRHRHSRPEQNGRQTYDREQELRVQQSAAAARARQPDMTSQVNGHVVRDISYRAATKEDRKEKQPSWLKKSYAVNEQTLDIADDASSCPDQPEPSSPRAAECRSPPNPNPAPTVRPKVVVPGVKASVSPKHSNLDSSDVLRVSEEFTIIDFVGPSPPQHGRSAGGGKGRGGGGGQRRARGPYDEYTRPTAITRYSAPAGPSPGGLGLADLSHGSGGSFVPPASTSTPRAPAEASTPAADGPDHHRQRKPREGSVRHLPEQGADIQL